MNEKLVSGPASGLEGTPWVVSEPGEGKARPSRVLYVTEGKDAETVQRAREWLQGRGVEAGQIQRVCADMSPASALGVRQSFPEATLVFHCFHVVSAASTAVGRGAAAGATAVS